MEMVISKIALKNIFTIIFILSTINIVAQNKSALPNSDLSKFFYNLPVDSCVEYIEKKILNTNSIVNFRKNNHFQTYKILQKEDIKTDSITMSLSYTAVPIGGRQGMNSPLSYEQWITKVLYFDNYSNSNDFFKNMKIQLDSLQHRFEPFYKEKKKELEWVYSFEPANTNVVQTRQVHLTFYKEENKVEFSYRIIYSFDKCK